MASNESELQFLHIELLVRVVLGKLLLYNTQIREV